MNNNKIREYIVIVNAGSGCIFQPMDEAYSYVLTAKHNITDNKITQLSRFKLNDNNGWDEIEISVEVLVDNENYFPHENRDIAIIKIEKVHGLENIIRFDEIDDDRKGYILAGYPETRRTNYAGKKDNWYRQDEDVTILNIKANQLREGKAPDNAGYDEIVGQSGGGILKDSGDYIKLAGIQNKMVDSADEQMGRIEFSPISLFDEIIEDNKTQLSPLYPPYIKSFRFLKEQIMELEGCVIKENIVYARKFLQNITNEISDKTLTPNVIKNKLNKRMLTYNEKEDCFLRKGLWIAWLEFLIVLSVLEKNLQTEQDLDEVFNKYRIIYSSSTEDWGNFFQKTMVFSDYKGLKENACVIFANDKAPIKTTMKKGVISNIARNFTRDEMKIDAGIKNPFESYRFIHIRAFQQDCIVAKEEQYSRYNNSNEDKLLQKLKKEYESIIKN